MLCIVLSIGTVITVLIRSPLRRQQAQTSKDILLENKNSQVVSATVNASVNL